MTEDKTLVERWGVNWSGTDATHDRMPDGYWTPWHIANEAITTQAAEIARWRECALYDATMDGPVFKGWDRSALERCRRAALGEQP